MSRDPYCDLLDVRRHLSFLPASAAPSGPLTPISATYRPNASAIAEHCVTASNEVDATLALVDYTIPVPTAATFAYEVVRGWAAVGAAAYSAQAMPQGKDSKHAEPLHDQFSAILEGIRNRDVALPGLGKEARSRVRSATDARHPAGPSPIFTREGITDR